MHTDCHNHMSHQTSLKAGNAVREKPHEVSAPPLQNSIFSDVLIKVYAARMLFLITINYINTLVT